MVFIVKNELRPQDAANCYIKKVTVWHIFTNQTFYHIKNPLKQCFILNQRTCIFQNVSYSYFYSIKRNIKSQEK